MKLAKIVDGVVTNVALVIPGEIPDFMSDWVETADAGPGWTWSELEGFSPPPEPLTPVPRGISRLQARLALLGAGLLQTVEEVIASSEDPMLPLVWAEASEWQRDSPTILTIAAQLGLSEVDVDELFRSAAAILV